MSRNFIRPSARLMVALAALAVAAPAARAQWSAESLAPEAAVVSVSGGTIQFYPSVAYEGAVLTVSRGELVFSQTFTGTERPALSQFDPEGNALSDGVYRWELELRPDGRTARELRLAATENDGKAPQAWTAQSGTFAIRGGGLASPELVEAGPARKASAGSSASPSSSFRSIGRAAAEDTDGSSLTEDEARAADQMVAANSMLGAGLQTPSAGTAADSDAFAAQAGAAPTAAINFSAKASVPHRSVEPGGKNGRPEKED